MWIRLKKSEKGQKGPHFPASFFFFYVRESKRERKRIRAFFQRSTEFRRSEFLELRTKVHRLDEGYAWVLKTRDFTEDPKEEISG